jgi:hypothetical protein
MGKFRAHNRFTIVIFLPNEEFKTKFTKMVDDLFADVKVVDHSTFTGNNGKEECPAVVIRCDSGTGLVNGTSFKWDINCDPEDEDVRNGFVEFCRNFPL